MEQITDHARRAILNVNPKFWGKPTIASFIWAITSEVQELEDAIFSVINLRMVDNAGDVQLEVLGRIVGQKNFGFDTETYRALIKAKIRTNRSRGTLKDILETAKLLHPEVAWSIAGWATLAVFVEDASELSLLALNIALFSAKRAEEGILLYSSELPTGEGLLGDTYTDTEPGTGGWGTVLDPSVGGIPYHVQRVVEHG